MAMSFVFKVPSSRLATSRSTLNFELGTLNSNPDSTDSSNQAAPAPRAAKSAGWGKFLDWADFAGR
jgi:hypothetical protein